MTSRSALWVNVWAGALAWFLSMLAGFALAPWACAWGWKPALPIVSLVAMLITAALALKAWNQWHQVGRETPGELGGEVGASRALASGGVLLNVMFFVVILAQLIGAGFTGACQ